MDETIFWRAEVMNRRGQIRWSFICNAHLSICTCYKLLNIEVAKGSKRRNHIIRLNSSGLNLVCCFKCLKLKLLVFLYPFFSISPMEGFCVSVKPLLSIGVDKQVKGNWLSIITNIPVAVWPRCHEIILVW